MKVKSINQSGEELTKIDSMYEISANDLSTMAFSNLQAKLMLWKACIQSLCLQSTKG